MSGGDVLGLIGQITALLTAVLGAGVLGSWLTHRRLAPKASAEAREITAAAIDKDWARFQREIARLVERCERAEGAAQAAVEGQRACEEREITLKARIAQLEAVVHQRGEDRRLASHIVAAERLGREAPA